jgi:pimeloyl-ACP methyl ester carboxylesterase
VLIIPGSEPNDRDGNQASLKSDCIKNLGTELAGHGIAVLRFDKRGSGRSKFFPDKESDFRFNSMITDAQGWLDLMRNHEKITRVGLIGHSQGSLVALLTAQTTKVAAVVSIAGAGQSIDKVMKLQLTERLATMPETRDQSLAIIKQLATGQTVDKIPPSLVTLFRPSVQPFLISWMQHDPKTIFAKSTTPTLIIQGTRDIQVSVTDARILKAAQPAAALVVIEDMNHVLRHIATDAEQLPSYSNPELPLAPELVPALLGFLGKELAARPPQ